MNLKRIILFVIIVGLSQISFGQEPIVSWGVQLNTTAPEGAKVKVLGKDNLGFYVLESLGTMQNPNNTIRKYSNSLQELFSTKLDGNTEQAGNKTLFNEVEYSGNGFMVFHKAWDRVQLRASYKVQKYNAQGQKVGSQSILERVDAQNDRNSGTCNASLSPDNTKLLIFTTMPIVSGQKAKIRLRVFNTFSLSEIWYKDIVLDDMSKNGVKYKSFVDNSGNAYVYNSASKTEHYLYTCKAYDKKWTKNVLPTDGKTISNVDIRFNTKGELTITGFYHAQFAYQLQGTFFFKFNNKMLNLAASNVSPFSKSLLMNWVNEETASAPGTTLDQFVFKDVLFQTSGNAIILAEKEMQTSKNLAPKGQAPQYDHTFFREDVMLICLKPDGSEAWSTAIKKQQEAKAEGYASFIYGLKNDNLYYFWNNTNLNSSTDTIAWVDADSVQQKGAASFTGSKSSYPMFMNVVSPQGVFKYTGTYGKPWYKGFSQATDRTLLHSGIVVPTNNGIIFKGVIPGQKYFKYGKINL